MKARKRESRRFFDFLALIFFFLLSAGMSHVWVNFKRTQIGYTLSQLKGQIAHIEEYNRKLKLEIAFLKSPEFLEDKAIREFGLQHPLPEQVVFLP